MQVLILASDVVRGYPRDMFCEKCKNVIAGYSGLDGVWIECPCDAGYVDGNTLVFTVDETEDVNDYALLDCGMFGEKLLCRTCRTEHFKGRPALTGEFRSLAFQCQECGM